MIVSDGAFDPDDCDEIAGRVLGAFARMFADMRRNDTVRIAAGELTMAQHAVLKAVMNAESPMRVSDLAAQENLAVPSMTIAIRRLVEHGQVRRANDPNDNRSVLVVATDQGAAAYEASIKSARATLTDKLDTFDATELHALAAALPALQRLVEIAAGSASIVGQ